MDKISDTASELFTRGHSCSEAVVKAAYETGLIDKNIDPELLNQIVSPFSGAMGTHQCLCGAVAGAQLVLGLLFGRTSPYDDPNRIKNIASEFNEKFKRKRNVRTTCCQALRAGERQNCSSVVADATTVLENIVDEMRCPV